MDICAVDRVNQMNLLLHQPKAQVKIQPNASLHIHNLALTNRDTMPYMRYVKAQRNVNNSVDQTQRF